MWNKISIRRQLILLITLALIIVELGTLMLNYSTDVDIRKNLAVEQAETLSHALQHDLVRAVIDAKADTYSDISFRISGFDLVSMLSVFDKDNNETFNYVAENFTVPDNLKFSKIEEPIFFEKYLLLNQSLVVEDYHFGEIYFLIDLEGYQTGLKEQLRSRLITFPIKLALGLLFALWIGRKYTRPFTDLAEAMNKASVEKAIFPAVKTSAQNEVGVLYSGYNRLTSEISRTTQHLKFLSDHDSLTGLYNRHAIDKMISACLKDEKVSSNVLFLMDIDQFKLINDTAGHDAGDELLIQLGRVLSESAVKKSKVARVGGDDYMILIAGKTEEEGMVCAESLLKVISDYRFTYNGEVYGVSMGLGLVVFKAGEYTLKSLGIAVDTAFYAAKSKGNNKLSVYRADDEKIQQYSVDVQTVAMIKDALKKGKSSFELYSQAIVPLQKESSLLSYEILLRMKDEKGQLVFPDLFLPVANRYQLMVDIDIYVLWTYLETATQYPKHIAQLDFVNVNLGGATLNNPDFQNKVREAIEYFDFPWDKLVLEVTETSAVGNLAKASGFIQYCRDLGIRVALDDFGTGMASFEYLKHLPLDVVKIDGSFVRDMLDDPVDHAMVRYVNDISKLRGQETIAEFVELKEHVEELKKIGIDYGQGYFLEKPKPLNSWISG